MRKWGFVVTLLYAFILLALLVPAFRVLVGHSAPTLRDFAEMYKSWITWMIVCAFVIPQIVLLSLSVDTAAKRLKPQRSLLFSAVLTGLFLAVITFVTGVALFVAIRGENAIPNFETITPVIVPPLVLWLGWGVLFYLFCRNSTDPVTRAVSWLFRGSVLELLVAVPTHVIVRRRDDCCAPLVTGFGITSGIAIMLLAFGPSVLLLFKKRMERYQQQETAVRG